MSHVIAGHREHRAWWRCGRLFWGWRWINGARARGSSYVLSTCWGDRKVRCYEYNVLYSGIRMCGVSYDVTGDILATLPSSVFYMCIPNSWLSFLVKNSLVSVKLMAGTEFSGQKLACLHQICGCNWVFCSKTLLFPSNLWLELSFLVKNSLVYIKFVAVTEFSGQKLSRLHQIYGCNWVFWSKTLLFTSNLWL